MNVATALAAAELRMLARDRVALFNVVIVPLAAAGWLITNPPPADELPGPVAAAGASVALAVFTSAALVLRAVTTLVQRRELTFPPCAGHRDYAAAVIDPTEGFAWWASSHSIGGR